MKKILLFIFMIFVFHVIPAYADTDGQPKEIDPAKRADIVKLMDVLNFKNTVKTTIEQSFAIYEKSMPSDPDLKEFITEFMDSIDYDSMAEQCIPIYDKYLEHEDIKSITDFYNSPSGKKLLKSIPAFIRDAFAFSQKWTEDLFTYVGVMMDTSKPRVSGNIASSKKSNSQSRHKKIVYEFMEVSGLNRKMGSYYDSIFSSLKSSADIKISPEDWQKIETKFAKDDFIGFCADIYEKNLDESTLADLVTYYKSPAGKKYLEVEESINNECGEVGAKVGRELSEKILQKFKK